MSIEREQNLIQQIDSLNVPSGQLALWSLGQAGFAIKGGSTVVYIDPYLSDSVAESGGPERRFPPPLNPGSIKHAQAVFATHEHIDHLDVATLKPLMSASPNAKLVTSKQGRDMAVEAGIAAERIIAARLGEVRSIADFRYTAVPAAHYEYEVNDGYSRWMGFLLECNGVTVYHAGDTIIFRELVEALQGKQIDIALLPFNGRDYFREQQDLIGNLWPREVVQLAEQLEARVLIGTHNDMFSENRVNPALLFDALDQHAPWQRCHLLQPGELYLYAG
jgi:L-ascorbate 6-phosphate lactonase